MHHPDYRSKYQENLKHSFPHIPFAKDAKDFRAFADAGKQLAALHVNYESVTKYEGLTLEEKPDTPLNWDVEKMELSKDKTQIQYNDFLTIEGIPAEVFEYRLGNRSALEWIIDQYCVTVDGRSEIRNDPNREDDPKYIVDLIARVITISLETVKIIKSLPEKY